MFIVIRRENWYDICGGTAESEVERRRERVLALERSTDAAARLSAQEELHEAFIRLRRERDAALCSAALSASVRVERRSVPAAALARSVAEAADFFARPRGVRVVCDGCETAAALDVELTRAALFTLTDAVLTPSREGARVTLSVFRSGRVLVFTVSSDRAQGSAPPEAPVFARAAALVQDGACLSFAPPYGFALSLPGTEAPAGEATAPAPPDSALVLERLSGFLTAEDYNAAMLD